MTTDSVSNNSGCKPVPEYEALIDFAARTAYSPQLLGDIDQLKKKHNTCDITSSEQAAEVAGKELEKLHPGIEYSKMEPMPDIQKAGIGVSADYANGILVIHKTLAGGPADKANLQPNDNITAVDDKTTKGLTLHDAVDLLRSKKNDSGANAGIGANLRHEKDGPVTIEAITKGSPAEKAGLMDGDKIVAIDGRSVDPKSSLTDSVKRMHGPEGSLVNLTVSRGGQDINIALPRTAERFPQAVLDVWREGKDFQVSVNRDYVEQQTVSTALGGKEVVKGGLTVPENAAYLKIDNFLSQDTTSKLWDALNQDNGGGPKVGNSDLVIDLRGNTGGRIDDVTLASSLFMDKGSLFQIKHRVESDPSKPEYMVDEYTLNDKNAVVEQEGQAASVSERLPKMTPSQLIVLTDEMTAGSAEMLASALRENAGATILGERTYGLGEVRMVTSMTPGGMLSVPMGQIYTSKGQWLGNGRDVKIGLTPDVNVATTGYFGTKQDAQLRSAFQLLEQRRTGK